MNLKGKIKELKDRRADKRTLKKIRRLSKDVDSMIEEVRSLNAVLDAVSRAIAERTEAEIAERARMEGTD